VPFTDAIYLLLALPEQILFSHFALIEESVGDKGTVCSIFLRKTNKMVDLKIFPVPLFDKDLAMAATAIPKVSHSSSRLGIVAIS
jgi:hypothetical protein